VQVVVSLGGLGLRFRTLALVGKRDGVRVMNAGMGSQELRLDAGLRLDVRTLALSYMKRNCSYILMKSLHTAIFLVERL
jgi:hypothetical protein